MRDFDPPIVVNCRDRVSALRKLVAWLELAGHERIVLLDNASTYEPLLEYLRASPHTVLYGDRNYGSRACWAHFMTTSAGLFMTPHEWFVYTDPDIVPIDDCPLDAIELLHHALLDNPHHAKAALGLYLDDVPRDMPSLEWEHRLLHPHASDPWNGLVGLIGLTQIFDSLSDTTFALYRPGSDFALQALRTGFPYQARHESPAWYGGELSVEDEFYLEHAIAGPHGSSWKAPE